MPVQCPCGESVDASAWLVHYQKSKHHATWVRCARAELKTAGFARISANEFFSIPGSLRSLVTEIRSKRGRSYTAAYYVPRTAKELLRQLEDVRQNKWKALCREVSELKSRMLPWLMNKDVPLTEQQKEELKRFTAQHTEARMVAELATKGE